MNLETADYAFSLSLFLSPLSLSQNHCASAALLPADDLNHSLHKLRERDVGRSLQERRAVDCCLTTLSSPSLWFIQ